MGLPLMRLFSGLRGPARPLLALVGVFATVAVLTTSRQPYECPVEVRQLTEPPNLVVYNRVPKCASLSTLVLFQTLNTNSRRFDQYMSNNFTVQELNMTQQKELIMNLTDIATTSQVPILYDRHVYFIDFEQHGFPQPVYINLIRDPIEQFASLYHFLRSLDARAVAKRKHMTLEECVEQGCREFTRPYHILLGYFCGAQPECLAGDRTALEISKRNIEKHFLLVGVQEQLAEFYMALEALLPSYFEGLYSLWSKMKSDDSMSQNVASRSRTISNKTVALMKERFHIDYDFYGYVQQRFQAIHRGLREKTLVYKTHRPVPMRLFNTQDYQHAKEAILKKYGRVGEHQGENAIFMTDGL